MIALALQPIHGVLSYLREYCLDAFARLGFQRQRIHCSWIGPFDPTEILELAYAFEIRYRC